MAQRSFTAFGTCALLALTVSARAQAPDPPRRFFHPAEVSPYVTSGGDATGAGATVRWALTPRLSVQAEGEYRHGERDVLRHDPPTSSGINSNAVLVLDLPRVWRVTPFVVGGGGLERHIDVVRTRRLDRSEWRSGYSFVVNGGGGVRVALTDRVGARVEIRYADGWAEGAWDSIRLMYGTTIGFGNR